MIAIARNTIRSLVGNLLRTKYQSPEYTTAVGILFEDDRLDNHDLRDILSKIERQAKRKGKQ